MEKIVINLYSLVVKYPDSFILGMILGLLGFILIFFGGAFNFDLQHIVMKVFGSVLIVIATGKLAIAYFKVTDELKELDKCQEEDKCKNKK